jgi:orotidine-5'-phosphate decarboxylase
LSIGPQVLVALDFEDADSSLSLVQKLDPAQCRLKVGKELFTAAGPQILSRYHDLGFEVFLDLKFHDIPNTVAKAVKAACRAGVWMVNVHASGGQRMLDAAREAIDSSDHKALLIAVTVLTSMDETELAALGVGGTLEAHVARLSALTAEARLDGVVCSGHEVASLKQRFGDHFQTVTPGIRPATSDVGDQRRVMTPAQAIKAGSDYLVIGRPITKAPDPLVALNQIHAEIKAAHSA